MARSSQRPSACGPFAESPELKSLTVRCRSNSIADSHAAPQHTSSEQFNFEPLQWLSNKVPSLGKSLCVCHFRTAKSPYFSPISTNLNTGKLPPCCGKSHAPPQDSPAVTHPSPEKKRHKFHRQAKSPDAVAESRSRPCQKSFKNRFMQPSCRRRIEAGAGEFRVENIAFFQSPISKPLTCLPSV